MLLKNRDEVLRLVADGYSGDAVVERALFARFIDAFELWQSRHKKYGRGNIAQTAATGIAVRLSDKVARILEYYIHHRGTDSADETIKDTFLDIVNYAAMALVCEAGEWPGAAPSNFCAATVPQPPPRPEASSPSSVALVPDTEITPWLK